MSRKRVDPWSAAPVTASGNVMAIGDEAVAGRATQWLIALILFDQQRRGIHRSTVPQQCCARLGHRFGPTSDAGTGTFQ